MKAISTQPKSLTQLARSHQIEWQPLAEPGVSGVFVKALRFDEETRRSPTILLKFAAGATYPAHNHPGGEEIFVIEGDIKLGRSFVHGRLLVHGGELQACGAVGERLYRAGQRAPASRSPERSKIRLWRPVVMSNVSLTPSEAVSHIAVQSARTLPLERLGIFYARIALGAAFLSAVASRFGIWDKNVGWEKLRQLHTLHGRSKLFHARVHHPIPCVDRHHRLAVPWHRADGWCLAAAGGLRQRVTTRAVRHRYGHFLRHQISAGLLGVFGVRGGAAAYALPDPQIRRKLMNWALYTINGNNHRTSQNIRTKKSAINPMPQYFGRYINLVADVELSQAFADSLLS